MRLAWPAAPSSVSERGGNPRLAAAGERPRSQARGRRRGGFNFILVLIGLQGPPRARPPAWRVLGLPWSVLIPVWGRG
eukprot:8940239-Pyramimonas_sp.AAC.1